MTLGTLHHALKKKYTTILLRKRTTLEKYHSPGELKSVLKFEQCKTWSGAECDHFIGTVTDVPASGYSVYLPLNNYTEASRIIRLLKANTAIMNLNTRAVAVEFVVYNPIVEMFSLVSLVTEMSVSGVVVPNAQFHTYQILPYTSYLWLQFLGECVIYAFFISHIYSWYQEHVNLNLYRSSKIFMAIKNRYVKVVPKWFYLWIVQSKQVQRANHFQWLKQRREKSQRLFERNDSAVQYTIDVKAWMDQLEQRSVYVASITHLITYAKTCQQIRSQVSRLTLSSAIVQGNCSTFRSLDGHWLSWNQRYQLGGSCFGGMETFSLTSERISF